MIDFNRPVQTRDGRKVRILCTDANGKYPIAGLVQEPDGTDTVLSWLKDGDYNTDISQLDLINAPVKRSVWLNIYPDRVIPYKDKVNADLFAMQGRMQDRVACIEVHYTEGEGLEDV